MHCYKLLIAYEGTSYNGWQIQSNATSIQAHIQKALAIALKRESVTIIGSGRTDTGVHAVGQVAHFHFDNSVDCDRLLFALNGLLPKDIRIYAIDEVPLDFHARYSAIGKEYHYHLHLNRVMNPCQRHYRWHYFKPLDLKLLKEGTNLFIGTHDFSSFANEMNKESTPKNAVRTIYELNICEQEGGIRLEFKGNGFLYRMVRNIVGTLVNIGSSKISIDEVKQIFSSKDRSKASIAAPAHGLFLMKVEYPSKYKF